MYVSRLSLHNIRSIEVYEIAIPKNRLAGWHVILGDNGAGKSTVVRALALALGGPKEAPALRQQWENWLRRGSEEGHIDIEVQRDAKFDTISKRGRAPKNPIAARVDLRRTQVSPARVELIENKVSKGASRTLWSKADGWFCASYGPFRRFSGGSREWEKVYYSSPRMARHLSVFGEDVALTEALSWLKELHVLQIEQTGLHASFLDHLKRLINETEFLPHGAKLASISSQEVTFLDGNGCTLPVDQLSDGYRSILSLTFELIRQMVQSYGPERVFEGVREGRNAIELPGVVAVDEIDAHMHPAWQRRVGPWFLKVFPKLQFFVTTHSPIVCQAAENGTVWRLPTPGSTEAGGRIEGELLDRLILGNVLEAYGTDFFGRGVTRSDKSKALMDRLAQLNQKAMHAKLTAAEESERGELRTKLPTVASKVTA